jgi:Zn ribbon nucleic-acid-binding protein
MATARDTLLADLARLLKSAYSDQAESAVGTLLDRFRIQSKLGPDSKKGTARELLSAELLKLWQIQPTADLAKTILTAVNQYRMQLKQVIEKKIGTKEKVKTVSKKQTNKSIAQPLAGGPQKRQRVRGECPKCHSMGVVLARSYNGDEYFSCIYCGYQTYRAAMDLEFDLPLAAELLNRRFDEKDQGKGR